jgi:predicted CXXCH cytochrome family protein
LTGPAAVRLDVDDTHARRGFGCVDCHGGDAQATDRASAHDPRRGYRAVPKGATIIATCARCHADGSFMRTFAPAQRIDQAAEYATSVHGRRLATGDMNVATCASCHGAHNIRNVNDVKSPVYPLNVATTCAKCHADPQHMSGYKTATGPLPTNQFDNYKKSVHYSALTARHDLSAPTCNDCHGNHGAAPPGVGAVANVCGTCHTVFADRFAASPHKDVFEKGCVECHENHAIVKPSDALLGVGSGAICSTCHDGDPGAKAATAMRASIDSLRTSIDHSRGLLEQLHNAGMEVGENQLRLRDAENHLTLARTEVHTFRDGPVDKVAHEGLAITTGVAASAEQGFGELRFRQRGLAVSMIVILLVVVALVLKIRDLERRPHEP